jgi:hypothetical protein
MDSEPRTALGGSSAGTQGRQALTGTVRRTVTALGAGHRDGLSVQFQSMNCTGAQTTSKSKSAAYAEQCTRSPEYYKSSTLSTTTTSSSRKTTCRVLLYRPSESASPKTLGLLQVLDLSRALSSMKRTVLWP